MISFIDAEGEIKERPERVRLIFYPSERKPNYVVTGTETCTNIISSSPLTDIISTNISPVATQKANRIRISETLVPKTSQAGLPKVRKETKNCSLKPSRTVSSLPEWT